MNEELKKLCLEELDEMLPDAIDDDYGITYAQLYEEVKNETEIGMQEYNDYVQWYNNSR